MTKRATIYNALPIVAAAYGEKFGVKVSIGTDMAYTDGESIVIPNIPEFYPHMDAIWGYLAHESAHIRFTDFDVTRYPGLHAELTNIIEDCRIEKAMISLYPGTSYTIDQMAEYMVSAEHYQHPTKDGHPAQILSGYSLYWLQVNGVGQSFLQPFLDSADAAIKQALPKGVFVRLNALLHKAVNIDTTAEAANIASLIIEMVKEEKQKEEDKEKGTPPPNPSQDEDGGNSGSGGNADQSQQPSQGDDDSADGAESSAGGTGDDGDSPASDGSQASTGTGSGSDAAGDPSDSQSGGKSSAGASDEDSEGDNSRDGNLGAKPDGPGGNSPRQALEQLLGAGEDDLLGDMRDKMRKDFEELQQAMPGNSDYCTVRQADELFNRVGGEAMLKKVETVTSKLRSQLISLVQASQRKPQTRQRRGKRVDTRNLYRVLSGDTRVFSRPMEKRAPNTAVHILVDKSWSMGEGNRIRVARESALALASALEAIPGVNPAVTFFGGNEINPVESALKHGRRVKGSAGKFQQGHNGGTPMAEALWYSAFELSKLREQRKIVLVITDGEPNSDSATTAILNLLQNSNIETIGIGIQSSAISAFIRNSIVISDVADLQKNLFRLMEHSLMGNAA